MLADAAHVAGVHALVPRRYDSVGRKRHTDRVEAVIMEPSCNGFQRALIRSANMARRTLEAEPRRALDAQPCWLLILTPRIRKNVAAVGVIFCRVPSAKTQLWQWRPRWMRRRRRRSCLAARTAGICQIALRAGVEGTSVLVAE